MLLKDYITLQAEAHDLTHLSIALLIRSDGVHQWTGCAQWDGFARGGIPCTHGHGDTPEEAMSNAIGRARLLRIPVEIEPITIGA